MVKGVPHTRGDDPGSPPVRGRGLARVFLFSFGCIFTETLMIEDIHDIEGFRTEKDG